MKRKSYSGQTAVITGAGDGLGLAMARRLKGEGVRVVGLDLDAGKRAHATDVFSEEDFIGVDVADHAAVAQAMKEIEARTGAVDILINSAGITGRTNVKTHEVEPEDFQRVMRVNVEGCLYTTQAVLPGMVERGYGRVLHIASISGKEGNAGMLAYSTSKAAVIGLTKVTGKEYALTGVAINCLAPAVVQTRLVDQMPEEQVRYMTDKIPMGRCGTLEEVADMAAWIVSPANSFTTGFCYDLSGGRAVY